MHEFIYIEIYLVVKSEFIISGFLSHIDKEASIQHSPGFESGSMIQHTNYLLTEQLTPFYTVRMM